MPSSMIAVSLCTIALAAAGPCSAAETNLVPHPVVAHAAQPRPAVTAPAAPRPGSELIKSAAAGTRDDEPIVARQAAPRKGEQEQPRRGGTAMLLAALALMSGIALRRYGAPGR